jgi:parallel beta-helix repeat protein
VSARARIGGNAALSPALSRWATTSDLVAEREAAEFTGRCRSRHLSEAGPPATCRAQRRLASKQQSDVSAAFRSKHLSRGEVAVDSRGLLCPVVGGLPNVWGWGYSRGGVDGMKGVVMGVWLSRVVAQRAVLLGAALLAGVALAATPALASGNDDGRGQDHNGQGQAGKVTSVTSCGNISAPGKYRLDADVTGGPCFVILANDVRFTLNGHTIRSVGVGGGIIVSGSGVRIVGPGTISAFDAVQPGISLSGGGGSVNGVTVTGSFGIGIAIGSEGNSVRGNVVRGNDRGIVVFPGMTDNTIIGNFARDNRVVDLVDANGNCTSNVWRGNDFDPGSADPSCIR